MLRKTWCLAIPLAVGIFCCSSIAAVASDEADDDTVLTIDAGRLVAMLSQVSSLMKAEEVDEPLNQHPAVVLEFVVERYNFLRVVACEREIVEGDECRTPYKPVLRPDPVPAPVLRAEINDAERRVLPFWEAVCAELDDPGHRTCQLE